MTSSYAFINTTPEVESTWTSIKQSVSNAPDRLEAVVALIRSNLGQLELKNLTAQLCFVAFRELQDMKALAGTQTDSTNKLSEKFDKKVAELFDLLDVEITYCDKEIKFSADELELPAVNQYNRWRLSRVQLFAVQALAYTKVWSKQMYKKRLTSLRTITDALVRFDTAQQAFLKSLDEGSNNAVKAQKKALKAKSQACAAKQCPPQEHRNAPYPPDLFKGQSTPLKPD